MKSVSGLNVYMCVGSVCLSEISKKEEYNYATCFLMMFCDLTVANSSNGTYLWLKKYHPAILSPARDIFTLRKFDFFPPITIYLAFFLSMDMAKIVVLR